MSMTRTKQDLTRNSGLIMAAQFAANISTFLMNLFLVRAYGQVLHDGITIVISLVSIVALLCDLGLAAKGGVREVARRRSQGIDALSSFVKTAFLVLFATGLLAASLVFVLSDFIGRNYEIERWVIQICCIWILAAVVLRTCSMVVIGFEKMRYLLVFTGLTQVLLSLWALACWILQFPIDILYKGWTVLWIVSAFLGLVLVYRVSRTAGLDLNVRLMALPRIAALLKTNFPFFMPVISSAGLPAIVFLLAGTLDHRQVSLLQVTFSIGLIGRLVSQPIATALFPILVRRQGANDEQGDSPSGEILGFITRFLGFAMLGILAGIFMAGGPLLSALYGPTYAVGLTALAIFTVANAVDAYRVQIDQVLMASGKIVFVAWQEAFKIVAFIGLSVVLFPFLPQLSIPLSVLAATFATTCFRAFFAKSGNNQVAGREALRALAALAGVSIVGSLTSSSLIILSAWVGMVILFRLISLAEIRALKKLFLTRTPQGNR